MKESPRRNGALTGCVSLVIDEAEVWKMKRQGRGGREKLPEQSGLGNDKGGGERRRPGKRTQDADEFLKEPAFSRSIYIYI